MPFTVLKISALGETCPESHADREEEGRMSGERSKWSSVFVIDFHPILPALQPPVVSLPSLTLPFQFSSPPSLWRVSTHHFRTTFLSTQWPWRPLSLLAQRSAASPSQTAASHSPYFFFSRRHFLSASSMQDPSALPGGGPTYPPSFMTTTSASCCWRRPGCTLPVTRPRSPTLLRLGTRPYPSPALQGGPAQKAGAFSTPVLKSFSWLLHTSN